MLKNYSLNCTKFLKYDLASYGLELFKGAKKILGYNSIVSIVIECGANVNLLNRLKDFRDPLVNERGFSFYHFLTARQLKLLSKCSEGFDQLCWQIFLACSPDMRPNWVVVDSGWS